MSIRPRTRVELLFGGRVGRPPEGVTYAPGRAFLLGDDAPSADRAILGAALDAGIAVAYGVRPDSRIVLWAMDAKAKDRFTSGEYAPTGRHWSDIARGLCAAVTGRIPGLDLLIHGDVPWEQGCGASTAYTAAMQAALDAVLGRSRSAAERVQEILEIEAGWGKRPTDLLTARVAVQAEAGDVLRRVGPKARRGNLGPGYRFEAITEDVMPVQPTVSDSFLQFEAERLDRAWRAIEEGKAIAFADEIRASQSARGGAELSDDDSPGRILCTRTQAGGCMVVLRELPA